jgi:chorismate mutase/prephenate dehydratase
MVSYFGPPGSFTHEVALKRFGEKARLEAETTIGEVFAAVKSQRARTGLVPIYNSTGGFVSDTLDELLRADFVRSGCRIAEELKMDIELCLLGRGRPRPVRRVFTHPIPLKHSRGWVRRHYPQAELIAVTSTSDAAKRATADRDAAAIGSEAAASRYGLRVWDRVRGAHQNNVTHFIVFGRAEVECISNPRTTIGFGLAHKPGTLAAFLGELAKSQLNLSRIVSRPLAGKAGEYVFLVEFEGDARMHGVQSALRAAKHCTTFLRVLGTYPAARKLQQGIVVLQ